jgi:hypothetical protein
MIIYLIPRLWARRIVFFLKLGGVIRARSIVRVLGVDGGVAALQYRIVLDHENFSHLHPMKMF